MKVRIVDQGYGDPNYSDYTGGIAMQLGIASGVVNASGVSETDTVTAGAGGPDDFDPLAEGPGDEEDMLDAAVQEAQDRVSAVQRALEQGKLALAEAEQALADAAKAKNSAFPPLSAAEAIQQFQRSEHEKRAAARGVVLGSGVSPIDAALKARRTNQVRRMPDLFSTKW